MTGRFENARLNILRSEEEIKTRIRELAREIDNAFRGEEIVVVGVLKGSFIFFADLIRQLKSDVVCEFLGTSDYSDEPLSSGEVKIILDLSSPVAGRNVLLVEDIVSDALTLHYLARNLMARGPTVLKTCCFVKKDFPAMNSDFGIDFVGFHFPQAHQIVGYGVDYEGRYRNLPYVAQIDVLPGN